MVTAVDRKKVQRKWANQGKDLFRFHRFRCKVEDLVRF